MPEVRADSVETCELLARLLRGDRQALGALLERHREALLAFVDFHLDPRLRGRFDPSDVVQETQWEAMRRMDDYLRRRPMPFRLWLRKQAHEQLLRLRRDHLIRARRALGREVLLPDHSSLILAQPLLRLSVSPSEAMVARERAAAVARAVEDLSDADRTILLMRHGENLPY